MVSHDACHAAEQGSIDSQVLFVRRSQQAKLRVCCSSPEGRNIAHFLAFDGRKERENLACPCCSFELHAMKTSVWMMKFRALFHVRNLAVYIGSHFFKLLTALAPCSFGFSRFGKIGQPHPSPKHTGVSNVFSWIWNFWKITNEGSHWKQMCRQSLVPRVSNFRENCL